MFFYNRITQQFFVNHSIISITRVLYQYRPILTSKEILEKIKSMAFFVFFMCMALFLTTEQTGAFNFIESFNFAVSLIIICFSITAVTNHQQFNQYQIIYKIFPALYLSQNRTSFFCSIHLYAIISKLQYFIFYLILSQFLLNYMGVANFPSSDIILGRFYDVCVLFYLFAVMNDSFLLYLFNSAFVSFLICTLVGIIMLVLGVTLSLTNVIMVLLLTAVIALISFKRWQYKH